MAHKQLTDREKYQIEGLKREGFTPTEIAGSWGRSSELARNSDVKGYRGSLAIRRITRRRQEAKK